MEEKWGRSVYSKTSLKIKVCWICKWDQSTSTKLWYLQMTEQTDKIWNSSQILNLTHKTFIRNIRDNNVGTKKVGNQIIDLHIKTQPLYESLFTLARSCTGTKIKQTVAYLRKTAINNVIPPYGKMWMAWCIQMRHFDVVYVCSPLELSRLKMKSDSISWMCYWRKTVSSAVQHSCTRDFYH